MKSRTRQIVKGGYWRAADRNELTTRDYRVRPSSISDRSQVDYTGGSGKLSTRGGQKSYCIVPALGLECTIDGEHRIYF